jgi:hypothetical protein
MFPLTLDTGVLNVELPVSVGASELLPPTNGGGLDATTMPVSVRLELTAVTVPLPAFVGIDVTLCTVLVMILSVKLGVVIGSVVWTLKSPPLDVGTALVAAPKFARKDGVTVAVPSYPAQPGTVVFGGAVPPPQSRNEHISPVPGT